MHAFMRASMCVREVFLLELCMYLCALVSMFTHKPTHEHTHG